MASSMPITDVVPALCVTNSNLNLSTQKGTPPLVSRLLPDVLQIIFIFCACDYYLPDYEKGMVSRVIPFSLMIYATKPPPTWVNISYVCRHWRDVALACPALWSYLFVASPRWTKELLARSKQAPLKLYVDALPQYLDLVFDFMEQVTNHQERIQDIDLLLENRVLEKKFYPWLSSRAPRLQNLEIRIHSGPDTERHPVLFGGDTPALTTLELSSCSVPWYLFRLTGLTTLGLHHVPAGDRNNPADLLAMLRSMQHLEKLYLCDALYCDTVFLSSAKSHCFRKINLPRLSRLSIVEPLPTIIAFLICADIPLKAELRLNYHYEDSFPQYDYALFFSLLGRRFGTRTDQGLPFPIFRSLYIDFCWAPDSEMDLTFSALELDFKEFGHPMWGRYNPLKMEIQLGRSVTCEHMLSDISLFVPLANVSSVHVSPPRFPAYLWRAALGHLQGLRYIKVTGGSLPNIAPVLSISDRTGDGESQGGHADRMLVPALEEVTLDDALTLIRPNKDVEKFTDLQTLCDVLASRRGSGRFLMTRCDQWKGDRVRMRDEVGEWKGGRFRFTRACRSRGLRF